MYPCQAWSFVGKPSATCTPAVDRHLEGPSLAFVHSIPNLGLAGLDLDKSRVFVGDFEEMIEPGTSRPVVVFRRSEFRRHLNRFQIRGHLTIRWIAAQCRG